jgi:hypothetical protein
VTVEQILEKYVRPDELLGGEPVKAPLLEDLKAQKQESSAMYRKLFYVVCAITIISVGAVVADLITGQKSRIGLLAAAGIPVPFMLNSLRRAVEQWSQTNLLITLVSHSDEKTVQMVIKKLLDSKALGMSAR